MRALGLAVALVAILPATLAFTVCGVDFGTPAYELNTRSGNRLIYVDLSGDLYIGSAAVHMGLASVAPVSSWRGAFIILYSGSPVIAVSPSETNMVGTIQQGSVPNTTSADFVIKNRSTGDVLAVFSHTGDIFALGTAVYQGAQAGCPADVSRMCNTSTGDIVSRDYYCDISSGSCVYTDTVLEDCVDTCSDTDNGQDFFTKGTVTDKDLCSSGDTTCPSNSYTDTCGTGNVLTEYYCSNNDKASTTKDCDDYDCTYNCNNKCNPSTGNIEKYCDNYECDQGACTATGASSCGTVETCTAGASDSDGGDKPLTKGTCTVTSPCNSSTQTECPSTPYTDYCSNSTTLVEYYVSGSSCASKTYDCADLQQQKYDECCANGYAGYCRPSGNPCSDGVCRVGYCLSTPTSSCSGVRESCWGY